MTISELLTVVEYPHTLCDGECVWTSARVPTPEELAGLRVVAALFLSHDFTTVDLDGEEYWDLDAVCGPGSMDVVKTRQCVLIREARRAAYEAESDHLGWEAEADGALAPEKRVAWLAKRDEIKARIPWPGVYR